MKKRSIILLLIALIFTLCACGSETKSLTPEEVVEKYYENLFDNDFDLRKIDNLCLISLKQDYDYQKKDLDQLIKEYELSEERMEQINEYMGSFSKYCDASSKRAKESYKEKYGDNIRCDVIIDENKELSAKERIEMMDDIESFMEEIGEDFDDYIKDRKTAEVRRIWVEAYIRGDIDEYTEKDLYYLVNTGKNGWKIINRTILY